MSDLVNGLFELLGALFVLNNCRAVLRDRAVKGVSILSTAFFTAWGFWNLYFYPHLGQWWSFIGGAVLVAANVAYVALLMRFSDWMTIGTKSVLFGAHAFFLHPLFIALGWWKLFGFPWDPRLWVAFFVHDLGYIGKPNMDGPEGETHPQLGAALMCFLFGNEWGDFCLLHSRYYAKRLNRPVSKLCHADKVAIIMEPSWLYLPRVWVSGELAEYMAVAKRRCSTVHGADDPLSAQERSMLGSGSAWDWHNAVKSYMRRWIAAHMDGAPDSWTRARHQQA
jgi:hypothetical protein